ncbi:MAG: vitamin K epoxide reductase family protein [Roseibacillus sp.]|nr:vitamin K epoxide reductase family protein [Roseibacillus sp.]MDP7307549.1 vitamin K epoxide reductase family protein [Roseibacillus sp.]HJM63948.1 vitamin K epoxide reductase family protein [Roseibacillus sp.]
MKSSWIRWDRLDHIVNVLPLLRFLALAGLMICGYLGILKLTGQTTSIVGCGTESGCDNALGSRWSQFFGIPVSVLAGVVYLALLITTWRPSRPLYGAFAICLTGAALWFIGLLYFDIKAVCPWCLAMHTIGIITSLVLILSLHQLPASNPRTPLRFAPLGAVAALLVLALGQLLGPKPDTHARTTEVVRDADQGKGAEGRVVSFFKGRKHYNAVTMPHLGPSGAKHVMVKYFDYTCSSCRDVHEHLHFVTESHPDTFCIILLPVPLNRACNPFFPAGLTDHDHACELARLSLAAWRANPERWPEVHEQLFSRPVLPPEVAEAAVGQIVGYDELAGALEDPWINQILETGINDFKQMILHTRAMPKLVVGDDEVLHGAPRSREVLLENLERLYRLGE